MSRENWVGRDARTIAAAVGAGQVSARTVVEQHLRRVAECNGDLNALVTVCAEQALDAADGLDEQRRLGTNPGPLAGVPFTVKDLIATVGVRTTAGSRTLTDNIPTVDAPAVVALKAAGAILIGKTNTPEFGACGLTRNELFGTTASPVRPDGVFRSPGGSNGGESASIAAGMSVLGLGTDFGGSVRWPAHCTGLSSVRPTIGRIDPEGQYPGVLSGGRLLANPATMHGTIQTVGPLARNLGDVTLALRVLSRPYVAWTEPDTVCVDDLDIRWAPGEGTMPVDDEIVEAVRSAARSLDACEYDGRSLARGNALFGALRSVETHADILALKGDSGHSYDPDTAAILAAVYERASADVEALWADRAVLIDEFLSETGDVLILPVVSVLAPPIGVESFEVGGQSLAWMDALASSRAVSMLGLPSVVVLIGLSRNGLPIGVQVVARPFHEHVALAVAARMTTVATTLCPSAT
ncbi:amidase [Rhodococcus sp. KBS0724]|uniref:amidase n=1 Tax=Rhodococcus sp. KBS0724 TaxID=1179674 RepID=UPI00110F4BE7|nr:amidase [Rhodococcus sp. KBS0724]TSD50035.1 amidase [Rhodococcus sp. KBS0724]